MGVFCTLQSANPKVIHQFHVFSFYVPSHMHSQIRYVSSNDLSVLIVLIQCLFWFIHIGFFFTLLTKSVGFVCFLSPMQHSHIHTVFKAIMNMMNTMIEKQKFVQCHWLVKIGEKKQDEMEKNWVLRLLTMEEAGSKRALGQKNSCESEHWKYSRKLCFSGRRRSVLIASRTSPYS